VRHARHTMCMIWIAILWIVALGSASCAEVRRLQLLYIGDYKASNPGVVAIESDPMILPSYVPATTGWFGADEIRRAVRMYLPRTYNVYAERFGITVLADADPWSLPLGWDRYVRRALSEAGRSVLMTGGHRGLGGTGAARQHWDQTDVHEVLPVTIIPEEIIGQIGLGAALKIAIALPDDPLVRSLPWKTCPPLTEVNLVQPREGATTPLVLDRTEREPVVSYWSFEKGRSLVFTGDWHGYATRAMQYWQFFDDAVLNMIYHAAGLKLPPDPIMAHRLRASFKSYRFMQNGLNSILEFVERFGANTLPLRNQIADVDAIRREGEELYLGQQYQLATSTMDRAIDELKLLEKKAIKLQEKALIWVYTIEWLAVSGTLMVAGLCVYELMVRRRLFRTVQATKSARSE